MKVAEVMSKSVVCAQESDMCDHAAGLMWANDIGAAPVLGSEGRVLGMVTDRDICMGAYTKGCRLSEIPVSEVMSRTVVSVAPEDPLSKAEELMSSRQLHRIPVIDQGRLCGMITVKDLARVARQKNGDKKSEVGFKEVTETVADIARPRVPGASAGPMATT